MTLKLTSARASAILGRDIAADTAIARFIASEEAQDAMIELVGTLFDVAIDAGQAPSDWNDISCEGSLGTTLEEVGFDEAYDDDADFQTVLDEHLNALAVNAYEGRRNDIENDVKNAKSLVALRDALEAASDFAKAYDLFLGDIYEPEHLPTFGGEMPPNGDGIWSYDEAHVLYGWGSWTIVGRGELHDSRGVVTQDSCSIEIDDIEYRTNPGGRYYFGRDQVDTIRFSRWKEQDATTSFFAGYIDIVAFDRDRVLLSELIERIKQREAELEAADEHAA